MMRPNRGIDGRRIGADDDQAHRLSAAHDRAVAFHADNAIDNRDRLGQRGVDVEHGVRNAGVMQDILGPAILDAGNRAV